MSMFLSFHYFYCSPADIESRKKKSDFGNGLGIVLLTSHSPQEKKQTSLYAVERQQTKSDLLSTGYYSKFPDENSLSYVQMAYHLLLCTCLRKHVLILKYFPRSEGIRRSRLMVVS